MKKKVGGRVGGGGSGWMWTKNLSFCENSKKNRGGGRIRGGGQGGCERRIEVLVKIKKKSGG